jgi:hypothetical protein
MPKKENDKNVQEDLKAKKLKKLQHQKFLTEVKREEKL